MRFTVGQYEQAIQCLRDGMTQLEPTSDCCAVCGDNGHLAYECGHNPLLAMVMCHEIARRSDELHESLHRLAGYDSHLGVQLGPACVVVPKGEEDDPAAPESEGGDGEE